jgi:tetratricopeptide (TPR) repeat protein
MWFAPNMVSEPPHPNCQSSSQLEQAVELLEAGNYTSALQLLVAIPQAIQDPENLIHQAVCLIQLGQPQDALSRCERVLLLSPHHSQAWLFKGVALHRLNRYQEAYACYNRALEPPPTPSAGTRFLRQPPMRSLKSLLQRLKKTSWLRLWVN